MIALILNSGSGKRMGDITSNSPKCMTEIAKGISILERQISYIADAGIDRFVITTGPYSERIEECCRTKFPHISFVFVKNSEYLSTNYIFSLFLASEHIDGDVLLVHGDLVFDTELLNTIVSSGKSCVATRSGTHSEKDFKAEVKDGRVLKIGVDIDGIDLLPIYHLKGRDWETWAQSIKDFCMKGMTSCYAEDAFNAVSNECCISAADAGGMFGMEIDDPDDLHIVREHIGRESK